MSSIREFFPVWDQLTPGDRAELEAHSMPRSVHAGEVIHRGAYDCISVFLVQSGQLRAYILSEEGKEITLYRLFERDFCLLSAPCMMQSLQFDLSIEAEKQSELITIPVPVYRAVMQRSAVLANYTNEIMASRFSDVMWMMDQILFKSFDTRLAGFLLEESAIEGSDTLTLTHEKIARHLGTAREVVTRMLKYFQQEGFVVVSRGGIELRDKARLRAIAT